MNPDLIAAIVAWLRADSGVVAALGENPAQPGLTKIHSDPAEGLPDPPYLVIGEPDEVPSFETADETNSLFYVSEGSVELAIIAFGKKQARDIGRTVAASLDDAPLTFADGNLLLLRKSKESFVPLREFPPNAPAAYQRVLTFTYQVERHL